MEHNLSTSQSVDPSWHPRPAMNTRRKVIRDALMRAIEEKSEDGVSAADRVARSMITSAIAGDVSAAIFVADRLDGKVPQALIGSDEDPPLIPDTARDMGKVLGLLIEELRARQIEATAVDVTPKSVQNGHANGRVKP